MNKKDRQFIWGKSDGHCWYCGCKLQVKGWHVDHVDPVFRESSYSQGYGFRQNGAMSKPENDNIDNLVPSCAPCNLFKATFTVEEFRREILMQVERARKTSVNFRTAERFELLEVMPLVVTFWFEQAANKSKLGGA